ncbi:hypothetical protein [Rubinisphaera italica]|uniref:Uncharacterized protein n=1 Tax=Rubinisphaera italica TaxID=2527969 RepID=A0A5C5XJ06_9PLAN|nr:hypothetical protein [Rubinisphaera italica]TWT63166.1 hypothetical protein Pan54_39190 [Rubinisphaera italica]
MKRDSRLLFPEIKKPRAKRRVLMKVTDVDGSCCEWSDHDVRFACPKCGYETEWVSISRDDPQSVLIKPCPNCNEEIDSNGK